MLADQHGTIRAQERQPPLDVRELWKQLLVMATTVQPLSVYRHVQHSERGGDQREREHALDCEQQQRLDFGDSPLDVDANQDVVLSARKRVPSLKERGA